MELPINAEGLPLTQAWKEGFPVARLSLFGVFGGGVGGEGVVPLIAWRTSD